MLEGLNRKESVDVIKEAHKEVINFLDILRKKHGRKKEIFLYYFVINYIEGILVKFFSGVKYKGTEKQYSENLESMMDTVFNAIKKNSVECILKFKKIQESELKESKNNTIH